MLVTLPLGNGGFETVHLYYHVNHLFATREE